jgi:glucose/arabinose dehydrogenase
MTFLPDRQMLVTEQGGRLWLVELPWDALRTLDETAEEGEPGVLPDPAIRPVSGLPAIRAAGQGGLGDVVLHPGFDENRLVYVSYVEWEGDRSGAVVARGPLDASDEENIRLADLTVIWRQQPKVSGLGHYGHRIAFSEDGYLYISSGERQKFDPAQDLQQNLGKIVRLHDDGSVPVDNPFAAEGGVTAEIWSLGHRNPLGMAFDQSNALWVHEMGPRGGDELNRIAAGENYGYPLVSNGDHYNGDPMPDHDTRPDLAAPAISWSPVISPSSLVVYSGERFPAWRNSGLVSGLSSRSLLRVTLDVPAREIERFNMGKRIREVEQGPDGRVFLLEDGPGGRLLHVSEEG